ncbi:MAG: inositol monophosphatase [Chloroflexaceae bacterium]|nr:inositol monophosphatase [Chloroflexaceae bacterium]
MHNFMECCTQIVRETGHALLQAMQQGETRLIGAKSSAIDLLTEADEMAQHQITQRLREAFPDHGILAEEGDQEAEPRDYVWVIDPIDGTTNYWHRHPAFCVSVALCHHGEPMVGAIYAPRMDELFCASRGGGAFCNDIPIHVSRASHLDQAIVATGFPYQRAPGSDNNLVEFGRVMPLVQGIRRCGSAALDLAYVAAGRLDGYWEFHIKPWDIMAGILLVREAGGQVSQVRPEGAMAGAGGILATNGHLHPALHRRIMGKAVEHAP